MTKSYLLAHTAKIGYQFMRNLACHPVRISETPRANQAFKARDSSAAQTISIRRYTLLLLNGFGKVGIGLGFLRRSVFREENVSRPSRRVLLLQASSLRPSNDAG